MDNEYFLLLSCKTCSLDNCEEEMLSLLFCCSIESQSLWWLLLSIPNHHRWIHSTRRIEENEADICLSSQPGPWLCAVKQHTVRFPTLQRCQRLGKYLYIISNISKVDGYGTECRIIHFGDFWNMKFWYCLPTLLPQVEQDFTLMFGEDVSGKLLERWPTMLKKTDGHTKHCKIQP